MGGFDHVSAAPEAECAATASRNARIGLWLFALYLAVYIVYVALCAFSPATMDIKWAGVNLAIWYGFSLIAFAFVLALLYGWLCRSAVNGERSSSGSIETEMTLGPDVARRRDDDATKEERP